MAKSVEAFLDGLRAELPEAGSDIEELANLHQRKLWHQLTVRIDQIIQQPGPLNTGDVPVRLFNQLILDFASRMNLLKFAQFAVHASRGLGSPAAVIDFLQAAVVKLEEMKLPKAREPILFLRMHIAQHRVEMGQLAEAKVQVEAGKEALEALSDPDPSVSAAVFYVASLYYKATADFAAFYRSALMYLSFVSSDTLPSDFRLRLAVDISLAALLGESVYSFGQLLTHPIINALDESPFAWLHTLLRTFNAGDIAGYDSLCRAHADALNGQPALVANERRLREKITIMALLDLIWGLPAEERRIPLAAIGSRTQLSADGVEFLLMKALALHLIEGSIDQVEGYVSVTWVAPRIMTKPQLAGLKQRLDAWIDKVTVVASSLENEVVGVA